VDAAEEAEGPRLGILVSWAVLAPVVMVPVVWVLLLLLVLSLLLLLVLSLSLLMPVLVLLWRSSEEREV
jgi:hypothetical protein